MRNILLFFCVTISTGIVRSQSLSPTVIATSNGSYVGSTFSMDYTVGETFINTLSGDGYILTQGFHQPESIIIEGEGCTNALACNYDANATIDDSSCVFPSVALASGPYNVCGSSPLILSAISNGNGQWSGGTGTFSDATLVNSTYTPGPVEIGTNVTLTWTTLDPDGVGPCTAATDNATVIVSAPASFTPLTPLTICSSSTASLSVTTTPASGTWTGGTGTYTNASSASTIYTPGPADVGNANLVLVRTTADPDGSGPCSDITVNQDLDVIGTSTAEAAGPYPVCGSTAIPLNATANGNGLWSGGAGTFSNATLVNSTYTPSPLEIGTNVTLTWTTLDPDGPGPCLDASDVATVNVSAPASFTPLTPFTICSSSIASLSVTTTPASGTWTGGTGTYTNASSASTIYTPG
ncbi:MAG: hypothetical protein ACKOW8_03140, partial [Flavobacteriales bacterium]